MTDIERMQGDLEKCKSILAKLWRSQPMTHSYMKSWDEHEIDRIVDGWEARWEDEAMEEADGDTDMGRLHAMLTGK